MEFVLQHEGNVIFKAEVNVQALTAAMKAKEILLRNYLKVDEIRDRIHLYAEMVGVPYDELVSSSRKRQWVVPRQAFMLIAKEAFPKTALTDIGEAFNRKDHTSVLHNINTAKDLRDIEDLEIGFFIEQAKKIFYAKEV